MLFHRLFNPIGGLLFSAADIQAAGAALARLVGVVGVSETDQPVAAAVDGPAELTMTDVRFAYDGADVLHGVSVTVAAGTRVALVGATGAGKSTLAAIAAGLLRPRSGTVTAGGAPPGPPHVAIVTQETHVFAGPLVGRTCGWPGRGRSDGEAGGCPRYRVGALAWSRGGMPGGLRGPSSARAATRLTAAQAQQLALARVVLAGSGRSRSSTRPPRRPAGPGRPGASRRRRSPRTDGPHRR